MDDATVGRMQPHKSCNPPWSNYTVTQATSPARTAGSRMTVGEAPVQIDARRNGAVSILGPVAILGLHSASAGGARCETRSVPAWRAA